MTAYTDRAAAVLEAVRDVARDLEADLAKMARSRGTTEPTTERLAPLWRDPGKTLAEYLAQKTEHVRSPERLIAAHHDAAVRLRDLLIYDGHLTSAELEARGQVITLADTIGTISNHAEAAKLVATFPEEQ